MVQFIREKTRQYAADKTGAIETGQVAKNIGEWADVMKGAANVYSAYQKDFVETPKKEAEEADRNIIKAQIGEKADIAAEQDIKKEIAEGRLNPNTTEGQKKIEEITSQKYSEYRELGTTDFFQNKLDEMQRSSADTALRKAYKLYDKKTKKDAGDSFDYISLYNSKMAEEAGKVGDFDSYMSFTESTTAPIVDYMVAHSADKDKQTAANKWRLRQGTSYLIGMAQANPVETSKIIGIQDRQEVEDLVRERHPEMSKKEVKHLTDYIMESEKQVADEKLDKIFGDKVLNGYGEDETLAREELRKDLRKALGRMVRKGMAEQKLYAKEDNYNYVANTYTNVLSPDSIVSADASLSLDNGVEQYSNEFISEAPNIKKSLSLYQDNSAKLKEDMFPNTEGTIGSLKQLQAFALSDKKTPAQKVELALNTMNTIHEEPITQEQYEEANTILFNALSDPENNKQLENTMALLSATILDNYAELFPTLDEMRELEKQTDKEFRDYSSIGTQSGIEKEYSGEKQGVLTYPNLPKGMKEKAKSFDYNKADEKSRAKYNVLRDTYAAVQTYVSKGDFESANQKLFALPYNIAKINYGGRLSPAIIDQFMQIDLSGKQSVYPQFEYNGYTFQYMGIDKTGIIKAKRIL